MPKGGGISSVEALARLGVDTGGRLLMLTEIDGIDLGEAQVDIELVCKYAGFAGGKAAIIGFITDAVLGRIIANNLPWMMFDAIKATVNQHFFVLADLSGVVSSLTRKPNAPTWSGDAASVLMGLSNKGG